MLIKELTEMAAFSKQEIGFGLTELTSDNFVLAGGIRSGGSSAGTTRLKYDIYDMEMYRASGDVDSSKIGFTELFTDDRTGDIVGLVNIELDKKFRRSGRATKLIQDLKDTTKSGLNIHDIQAKAKKFWDSVGVQYKDKRGKHGHIPK